MAANHGVIDRKDDRDNFESKKTPKTWTKLLDQQNVDRLKVLSDLPLEAGFEPDIDEEFQHIEDAEPTIPHIFHFIWLTGQRNVSSEPMMPQKFTNNVKSFLTNHPNWTFYFWTDSSSRKLIEDRHKKLLFLYDHASNIVVKSDILRYVVIYEFGGVYTDVDTVSVRPMDIATTKYSCVLIPIPFEQSVFWTYMPFRLCNGEMMCRAKHPFFKQCIEALPGRLNISSISGIAGPLFINEMFLHYNNISKDDTNLIDMNQDTNSPYFFKGRNPPVGKDGIYIPNTRYFLYNPSPAVKQSVTKICSRPKLTDLFLRACFLAAKLGYNRTSKFMFIKHKFAASWMGNSTKGLRLLSVSDVIPNFTLYT